MLEFSLRPGPQTLPKERRRHLLYSSHSQEYVSVLGFYTLFKVVSAEVRVLGVEICWEVFSGPGRRAGAGGLCGGVARAAWQRGAAPRGLWRQARAGDRRLCRLWAHVRPPYLPDILAMAHVST